MTDYFIIYALAAATFFVILAFAVYQLTRVKKAKKRNETSAMEKQGQREGDPVRTS